MKLREQSQVGYLMAQYVGAMCIPAVTRDMVAQSALNRRRPGKSRAPRPLPVSNARPSDQITFTVDEMLHWPSAESMLAGEPPMLPEEFERSTLRAGGEAGGFVTRVDREAGTVTVSGAPATRVCACSRVVPLAEWDGLYDSCSECADRAASYGDNWREAWAEFDRDRLVQEEQAGA